MARQAQPLVENNFSKGVITSSTGLNFPPNAVTSASNCIFDYLGNVDRREGFDFEVGNTPKNASWGGSAISSFLWHNVIGDNTTNVLVVQVGGLLYFYNVDRNGAAISPNLLASKFVINDTTGAAGTGKTYNGTNLDFSSYSSQALNAGLISPSLGTTKVSTNLSAGNTQAPFDGFLSAASTSTACLTDGLQVSGQNTFTISQVGKDFGSNNKQLIGSGTLFGSSDKAVGFSSYTYNSTITQTTYTYQFVSQTYILTVNPARGGTFVAGGVVTGVSSGATGSVAAVTPRNDGFVNLSIITTNRTNWLVSEGVGEILNNVAQAGGAVVAQTTPDVVTTLNQTSVFGPATSTITSQGTANVIIQLKASNVSFGDANGTIIAQTNGTANSFTVANPITNDTRTWQYVWFQIFNTTTNFGAVPPSSDTGTITAGGSFPGSFENQTVTRTQVVTSPVSIQEQTCIVEAQFFVPKTSISSPFVNNFECQYANGLGYLFVTHPWCYPFVVKYDKVGNTFTSQPITIQIRDFDGVDDALQLATGATNNISSRPFSTGYTDINTSSSTPNLLYNNASYLNLHMYNLQNQGWDITKLAVWLNATSAILPSNCDVWWYLKNADDASQNAGSFNPNNVSNIDVGSTAAPRGSFIFDAFYIDRGALVGSVSNSAGTVNIPTSGATGLGVSHSNLNRPSTVAFFAGRAWYAGVNYPNFSNCIWFSQIISPTSSTVVPQLGQCYQTNDPTSSKQFDLLATDGGTIRIPDCGTILKLFPMHGALVVFATNGIWVISGSKGGLGFTANDYSINRLSSMNCLSGQSVVDILGNPYFWTNEGVYNITTNMQAGGLEIKSLTYDTIDTLYKKIPRNSKVYARGAYNPFDYTVQWLYRSTQPVTTPDDNYKYDSILTFNTLTGAFYFFTVGTGNVNLASVVTVETGLETDVTPTNTTYTYKYFVTYNNTTGNQVINIADMFSTRYRDWYSFDNTGQQYTSSFTSGYKFMGQGQRRGIPDYLHVYVDNSIPGNAYRIQSVRDYGAVQQSGKWSGITATTSNNSLTNSLAKNSSITKFSNIIRKHRLRGRGFVMQFKISNLYDAPFSILGWSAYETAAGQP